MTAADVAARRRATIDGGGEAARVAAAEDMRRLYRLTPRWTQLKPHAMQAAFCWHPSRFKINPSGRRSGKTELVKRMSVWELLKRRPWPAKLFLAAPSFGQARDIFWDDLRALIPPHWVAETSATRLEIKTKWGAMVRVFGFDRPRRIEGVPWDFGAIDEQADCFVAGTMVDTPAGPRAIETIRAGDTVCNAAGVGVVTEATKRVKNSIAVVRLPDGSVIISSDNHRYFTRRGWVMARDLRAGDELVTTAEAVRMVRGAVHSPGSAAALLRDDLCAEMDRPAGAGTDDDAGAAARRRHSAAGRESQHGNRGGAGTPERGTEGERLRPAGPRRQGPGHDRAPAAAVAGAGPSVPGRSERGHRPSRQRLADQLHDRHSQRGQAAGRGSGRAGPRRDAAPQVRPAKGHVSGVARVASAEVYKPGSDEFRRYGGGENSVTLYDLSVSGHPSFSVNGFLVHNCPRGSFGLNVLPAMSTLGREGKCCLVGVPDEVGRNQAEYEELFYLGLKWQPGRPGVGQDGKPLWDHETCSFHWSSADILTPEAIASMRAKMDDHAFEQELGGRFCTSGGKALHRFDRDYHVDEGAAQYSRHLPLDWSLDFGVSPAASLLCQTYRGHVFVLDEIVINDGSTDGAAEAMGERIKKRGYGLHNGLRVYGDAAGNQRHSPIGTSDYDVLEAKLAGWPVEWQQLSHNPLVKDTLNAVRGRVSNADGLVRLHIHPRCERLIQDCTQAPWPDPGNLRQFHALAALRYYCHRLFGESAGGFTSSPLALPSLGAGGQRPKPYTNN